MATDRITIQKVLSFPTENLTPNAMFLTKQGTELVIGVVDKTGTSVVQTITTAKIQELIGQAIANMAPTGGTLEIVPDIEARDALELDANAFVLVLDATGDDTVKAGAALYVYNFAVAGEEDGQPWIKVAEYESLDVELKWENITGGPTSAPGDIDATVTFVAKLGEDDDGDLTFNGEKVKAETAGGLEMTSNEW